MGKISAYAKLLRLPGIGALGIPPVIAALTMGIYDFFDLTIVFIIGALSCIFGFLLNDYVDVEVDKLVEDLRKKPLVSGEISRKSALIISIILILVTFFFISLLYKGEQFGQYKFFAVTSIIIAGCLGSIYNIYGKKIIGSDLLVAISVAFVFLFGALSYGQPNVATWIIFFLTFNNILYMNAIQGGLKDADHDYKMKVKNIALKSGLEVSGGNIYVPFSFKILGMTIRIVSAILLFLPFILFNYNYYLWQITLLIVLTSLVLIISFKFLNLKKFDRNKIRRIIGFQSFLRYSLVPIMLMSIIDIKYSVILIIVPILWYIIFTNLVSEELFKPRM
ncbi:MAG: UbiA family prenyltransferase [Candidatus Thermoplasmatota archaeon]